MGIYVGLIYIYLMIHFRYFRIEKIILRAGKKSRKQNILQKLYLKIILKFTESNFVSNLHHYYYYYYFKNQVWLPNSIDRKKNCFSGVRCVLLS